MAAVEAEQALVQHALLELHDQRGQGLRREIGRAKTFWERSLFTKPQDRDVVCHASAWDPDQDQDLRIKMCIEITGEDFVVIHHELGHNIYQRAYRKLPFIYRNSANDGLTTTAPR